MASISKRVQIWLRNSSKEQRAWIGDQLIQLNCPHPPNSFFLHANTPPSVEDLNSYFSALTDTPELQQWLGSTQAKWRDKKRRKKRGVERITVSMPTDVWSKIEEYMNCHKLSKSEAVVDYLMESGIRSDKEIEKRIEQVKEQKLAKLKDQIKAKDKRIVSLKSQLSTASQANDRLVSSCRTLAQTLSQYKARYGEEGMQPPFSAEEIERQKAFYENEIEHLRKINGLRDLTRGKFSRS